MKEKTIKKADQQAAGSSNSGSRSEDPIRKKDREIENEENIKAERHFTRRLAKRMYHPDGPGGGYDGL